MPAIIAKAILDHGVFPRFSVASGKRAMMPRVKANPNAKGE